MLNEPAILITEKRITKTVINIIKKNLDYRNRIVALLGNHHITFARWIEENHKNLTSAKCLEVISKVIGIPQAELLEDYLPKTKKSKKVRS